MIKLTTCLEQAQNKLWESTCRFAKFIFFFVFIFYPQSLATQFPTEELKWSIFSIEYGINWEGEDTVVQNIT